MVITSEIEMLEVINSYLKEHTKQVRIVRIILFVGIVLWLLSLRSNPPSEIVQQDVSVSYILKGETVAEMINSYEQQSGKHLSTWFKGRITERCSGKNHEEMEYIINQIGATAPTNN